MKRTTPTDDAARRRRSEERFFPPERVDGAERFCREILPAVSRTFAVSIRLLPGALGSAVRTAYLLCRIADTVEDAPELAAADKAALLDELAACFEDAANVSAFVEHSAIV